MPWCDTCSRFWTPTSVDPGGNCPTCGRPLAGKRATVTADDLDLKELAALVKPRRLAAAIRAPWGESEGLRTAVRRLREQGEAVVCILPGHEHEGQEFDCDRELVAEGDRWVVHPV